MSSSGKMARWFGTLAQATAHAAGRPLTFLLALCAIVVWAIFGPLVGFTDTWQLIINTGTTIVTFLMVFLIQNTQNRDSEAMHIKLDALVHASRDADDSLLDLEQLDEKDLEAIRARYTHLAERARREKERRSGSRAESSRAG